jgi:hypothetical protein
MPGRTPPDPLARLRDICRSFPEVVERPSHGAPTWFVRGRASFLTLWADGHHDNAYPHLWCAAPPGEAEALISAEPQRYFRPPYVGHRGWLGVRLDAPVDWVEMAEMCAEAYRTVAPKRLVALLDAAGAAPGAPDRDR